MQIAYLMTWQQLEGQWPDKVLTMQRNWIGRSQGANVTFEIQGRSEPVTIYTTRLILYLGQLLWSWPLIRHLPPNLLQADQLKKNSRTYLEKIKAASDIDRLATDRPKSGVDLKRFAVNPVNGEKLPIWASDYVLADYGTGAIMAVSSPRST
jgi:leucyl-tRNA synthetase